MKVVVQKQQQMSKKKIKRLNLRDGVWLRGLIKKFGLNLVLKN